MRFQVSDTHSTLEEPNGTWFVIDTKTKKRFGFGFTDFALERDAREFAQWLNHAYELGRTEALMDHVSGRGDF